MKSIRSLSPHLLSEGSTGLVNGLILCINSFTFGSLMVSRYAEDLVGVAIGTMLIAGIFGSLYGFLSKDKTLVCGPSGTVASIMAGPTLIFFAGNQLSAQTLIFPIALLGILVSIIFYLTARLGVSYLFKFIPYSVFLGLMAATGYLVVKGAISIIFGGATGEEALNLFLNHSYRLQFYISVSIALTYILLSPRVSLQLLYPLVLAVFTLSVTFFLNSGLCQLDVCSHNRWFFSINNSINWIPSWEASVAGLTFDKFIEFLPIALSVAFVCVLSILVSFENLFIWFGEEFDAHSALKNHSILIAISALFGGFIPNLAFQRVVLNKTIGVGLLGSIVTASIAFFSFFYIDQITDIIPRSVVAGFLLFQGIEIIRKSLSNVYKLTYEDLAIICLIVGVVALNSFVHGFIVGLVLSFIYSIYSLSRIPLVDKECYLADLRSPIIRPHEQCQLIAERGKRIKYYRFEGYLFYGTITQFDAILAGLDFSKIDGILVDASKIIGLDTSATISFGKILARYQHKKLKWYVVAKPKFSKRIRDIAAGDIKNESIAYYDELNPALEDLEEKILAENNDLKICDCLQFLKSASNKTDFQEYCERISLLKNQIYSCDPGKLTDLLFVEEGVCSIELQSFGSSRSVAKVFAGALIDDLNRFLDNDADIKIIPQSDLVLLKLSESQLLRMRSERPDLYNLLNEFLVVVLRGYLFSAKKLISAHN